MNLFLLSTQNQTHNFVNMLVEEECFQIFSGQKINCLISFYFLNSGVDDFDGSPHHQCKFSSSQTCLFFIAEFFSSIIFISPMNS